MSMDATPTFLAKLARRPFPVFLGLAVGFLGCCIAGRVAARQQPIKDFVRFHPGIAPETHYYPTYSQTLNLARQHASSGKVVVVIGSNSVLLGVGQRVDHVWTHRLQELLGEDYIVLNLAMRGGWSNEFGGVIAERLAADGVPVIFVTLGTENTGWGCDWDGGMYRYFFWDAWGKGLVPPDSRRDQWLESGFYERHAKAEKVLEHRRRGLVDGVTYAQDLWNYVAYCYRGTVWTPMKYPKFWTSHHTFPDNDPGPAVPFDAMHNDTHLPIERKIIQGRFQSLAAQKLLRGEGYDEVGEQFKAYLPDALQGRTLYLLRMEGKYYRDRLTPEDRAKYDEVSRRYRDAVQQAGLPVLLIGENYVERDYFDRSHIAEQGGKRLAEDVAPTIRQMGERLYGIKPPEVKGIKP